MKPELELADWRAETARLYAQVRAESHPERAHRRWQEGRDALFRTHPQSPLPPDSPLRATGLPYAPYEPAYRFALEVAESRTPGARRKLATGDTTTSVRSLGRVVLPSPVGGSVELWWMEQYAGGLFVPLRDGSAGRTSYGGGRYLVDTSKGADLGLAGDRLVVDLNFLYHPSCRYDDRWICPLAPPESSISAVVDAGELMG